MLDLNELERRLDEALANETEASLSEWILNQRNNNLSNFLGLGCFEERKDRTYSYSQSINTLDEAIYMNEKTDAPNSDFAIAA
jgi:hypothetical protein